MAELAEDTLCNKLAAAVHLFAQGTHNKDTAEVALEVVPVVTIVHSEDLVLFRRI